MTSDAPSSPPQPVGELTYAQASAELETIIRELDGGVVDVDVLEASFLRAIEIVEELDSWIRRTRERVDELMPRLSAIAEEPSDPIA